MKRKKKEKKKKKTKRRHVRQGEQAKRTVGRSGEEVRGGVG